jgi:hypothetical protein
VSTHNPQLSSQVDDDDEKDLGIDRNFFLSKQRSMPLSHLHSPSVVKERYSYRDATIVSKSGLETDVLCVLVLIVTRRNLHVSLSFIFNALPEASYTVCGFCCCLFASAPTR